MNFTDRVHIDENVGKKDVENKFEINKTIK